MKKEVKSRTLHRIKIIQGQLKGLENMIAREDYCMDILTQSLAIQKSLSSLDKLVVENHITSHIEQKLTSGSSTQKAEAIEELLSIYELHNRRGK